MADTVVHVRIPDDLLVVLDRIAEKYEGSRSMAIRALIRSTTVASYTTTGETVSGETDSAVTLTGGQPCQHRTMRGLRCADCGKTAARIKGGR